MDFTGIAFSIVDPSSSEEPVTATSVDSTCSEVLVAAVFLVALQAIKVKKKIRIVS
jgi:hypothetical protein